MTIKNDEEIQKMRKSGKILAEALTYLSGLVAPGVNTNIFDAEARKFLDDRGAKPSFLGYRPKGSDNPYPSAICVNVNDELVHGTPRNRVLIEGDIISLDFGVEVDGYHTDSALTLPVGNISSDNQHLLEGTKTALDTVITTLRAGVTVGDIGEYVESVLLRYRLGIVKELVGHGIGKEVHEDPIIPNYGVAGQGVVLRENMTVCIEPMAGLGSPDVYLKDEWTYAMKDGKNSAHFEHTILITKDGSEVLTARD